jgi:hypothetical protein
MRNHHAKLSFRCLVCYFYFRIPICRLFAPSKRRVRASNDVCRLHCHTSCRLISRQLLVRPWALVVHCCLRLCSTAPQFRAVWVTLHVPGPRDLSSHVRRRRGALRCGRRDKRVFVHDRGCLFSVLAMHSGGDSFAGGIQTGHHQHPDGDERSAGTGMRSTPPQPHFVDFRRASTVRFVCVGMGLMEGCDGIGSLVGR